MLSISVDKAKIRDVPQIHRLINNFADKGEMLARTLGEIYDNIRDFFVVRHGERVIGCAAVHVSWADLVEIKSVAVVEDSQQRGVGTQLVAACIKEAREIGIPNVYCLTYRAGFFKRFGFSQVDKMELPRKIWTECYLCPKFPDCDEIALIYHMEA